MFAAMITWIFFVAFNHACDDPFILYPENHNVLSAPMLKSYIYAMTHQYSQILSSPNSTFIAKYQTLNENKRHGFLLLSNITANKGILSTLSDNQMITPTLSDHTAHREGSHSIHLVNDRTILCLNHHGFTNGNSADYCIFSLLQLFGVRFRIHDDIVPRHFDKNIHQLFKTSDAFLHTKQWLFTPTFSLRGIQPFHDFAEGPDWWDRNDYKMTSHQIYKMKMNFQGYHTYPNREPLVWTGLDGDFDPVTGDVMNSYSTSWMTTLGWVGGASGGGGDWGGVAINTSDYVLGGSLLYYHDCYSNDIQQSSYPKLCPFGKDMASYNDVFNNAGDLLHDVFSYAKLLGINNCVGTEVPLALPPSEACNGPICPLRTYYSSLRGDHFVTTTNCLECQNLYKYVRTEGWIHLKQTSVFDTPLSTCFDARKGIEDNVLVIGNDQTACPPEYVFVRVTGYASSMNGSSMLPLIAYFNADVKDHWSVANETSVKEAIQQGYKSNTQSKIVYVLPTGIPPDIPIMNDSVQYYQGMFNRIKAKYPIDYYWLWTPEQWQWNKMTTNDSAVQEAVVDINAAFIALKNVDANFSLATCGWEIGPYGNRTYLNSLIPKDIVMSSIEGYLGQSAPDPAYGIISKDRETWDIPWMEDDPDLTALQIWVNRTMSHIQIAQGYGVDGIMGIHWRTQEVSPQISALSLMGWNVSNQFGQKHGSLSPQTSFEFWMDWVSKEFNLSAVSVIQSMATLFNEEMDSTHLPNTHNGQLPMQGCPGILMQNVKPWSEVSMYYGFVDTFNAFRPHVVGAENVERFEYWSNMFEYLRMMGKVGVDWGHLNESNGRDLLVNDTTVMINYLMAAMRTKGTMGTLTNIQQQLFPKLILANKISLPKEYSGETRMWLMAPRSMIVLSEDGGQYDVEIVILSKTAPRVSDIVLYYRELRSDVAWNTANNLIPKGNGKRQVYVAQIGINSDIIHANGFEFYVESKADAIVLRWPVQNSYVVTVIA